MYIKFNVLIHKYLKDFAKYTPTIYEVQVQYNILPAARQKNAQIRNAMGNIQRKAVIVNVSRSAAT
jgi:hypothetical protein